MTEFEVESLGVGHSVKNDTKGFIPGHSWKIYGAVSVKIGDDYIVERAPNHFVNAGLKGIVCILTGYSMYYVNSGLSYAWSYQNTIYLGHDTTTATTYATSALTNQEATACTGWSQGATTVNAGNNGYYVRRVAQWAPNAFAGSVGEMGLFMRPFNVQGIQASYSNATLPLVMVSRFSNADGDFTTFTPASGKSTTVEWELGVTM